MKEPGRIAEDATVTPSTAQGARRTSVLERVKRSPWTHLAAALTVATLAALLSVQAGVETHALRDHGRVVRAMVTGAQVQGKHQYVQVRFQGDDGRSVHTYLEQKFGYPKAGDTIPVRYLPEDPAVALDARVRVWYAHCVLAALGSLLALGYAGWTVAALGRRTPTRVRYPNGDRAGARGGPARAGPPSATR